METNPTDDTLAPPKICEICGETVFGEKPLQRHIARYHGETLSDEKGTVMDTQDVYVATIQRMTQLRNGIWDIWDETVVMPESSTMKDLHDWACGDGTYASEVTIRFATRSDAERSDKDAQGQSIQKALSQEQTKQKIQVTGRVKFLDEYFCHRDENGNIS